MPIIELITTINADIEICFNLSRSIDLHKLSIAHTHEDAIDGKTSGLINLNEFVTWKAKHFGITQQLTSKIAAYNFPSHFKDEQVKGAFKYFTHDHYFESKGHQTIMKDVFHFESPFGILGKIFNKIILTSYMRNLLITQNKMIKEFAETAKWKDITKNN